MNKELLIFVTGWASPVYLLQELADQICNKLSLQKALIISADQIIQKREIFWRELSAENQSITVIGWSMGGMLALEAAMHKWCSFNKIFLISSSARMVEDDNYTGVPAKQLRAMKIQLSKNKVIENFWSQACSPEEFNDGFPALKDYSDSQNPDCLIAGLEYLERTDLRAELKKISSEIHVIHGSKDKIMPVEHGKYLAENTTGNYLEIPESSHLPFLRYSEQIADFITGNLVNCTNRFSEQAGNYDQWTVAQKQIAQYLLTILKNNQILPETVLDIGCGTGYLSRLLLDNLPDIQLTGIDWAEGMVEICRRTMASDQRVQFELADARYYNQKKFDLLTSNCALQWITDLNKFFADKKSNLNPRGLFSFATLVQPTFSGLQKTYYSITGKNLPGINLKNTEEYIDALKQNGFKIIHREEKPFTAQYKDSYSLLKSLKMIGAIPEKDSYTPLGIKEIRQLCRQHDKLSGNTNGYIQVNYQALFIIADA